MKRNIIVLLLLFVVFNTFGQDDYFVIDFVGEEAGVESVYVENITQGTSVFISGEDVLHLLTGTVNIDNINKGVYDMVVFPNPMEQTSSLEFFNAQQGNVLILIYSITGKQIFSNNYYLPEGEHTFSLAGIPTGSYIISVHTKSDNYKAKLISLKDTELSVNLNHKNEISSLSTIKTADPELRQLRDNKQKSSIVEMPFNIGDELKFSGFASDYDKVTIYDSPASDYTYTFVFADLFECGSPYSDSRDGYTYQTVKIGEQCWLAENLKYIPKGVDISSVSGSSTSSPHYYVYDFEEGGSMEDLQNHETFANYNTYGILYNWPAAMGWDGEGDEPEERPQGICPNGWVLPSHDDWTTLERSISSNPDDFPYGGMGTGWHGTDEGDALKDEDYGWCNEYPCGSSGFAALPGGRRYSMTNNFYGIGEGARWWTSSEFGAGAWRRYLEAEESSISRFTDLKSFGFSVRCVRE